MTVASKLTRSSAWACNPAGSPTAADADRGRPATRAAVRPADLGAFLLAALTTVERATALAIMDQLTEAELDALAARYIDPVDWSKVLQEEQEVHLS